MTIGTSASAMSQIVSKLSTKSFGLASFKETLFGASSTRAGDEADDAGRAQR